MLYTLIYKSRAIMDFGNHELRKLLGFARKNNEKLDITGMLLYADNVFLQALEGEEDTVLSLYRKIQNDTRHIDITILFQNSIDKRMFPDWTMGYKNLTKEEYRNIPGLTQFLTDTNSSKSYELLISFKNDPSVFK